MNVNFVPSCLFITSWLFLLAILIGCGENSNGFVIPGMLSNENTGCTQLVKLDLNNNEFSGKNANWSYKYIWIDVFESAEWDKFSDQYVVKAIPRNFLKDESGLIIAKQIRISKSGTLLSKNK